MFGAVLAIMVLVGIPAYVYTDLAAARERNDDMRKLLRQMDRASELLAKNKSARQALDLRYARPAPALASFIESAASANGLEVPKSTDRADLKGKEHTERITEVEMRKVNLKPLVDMLEHIERSGHPVAVSKLSIKKRAGAPDQYDVRISVSAYDRNNAPPRPDADKTKKADDKGKAADKDAKGKEL